MSTAAQPALTAAQARAFEAFDHLATMVAVVHRDGHCLFANAAFEHVLGLSRRSVLRGSLFDWFVDTHIVRETVAAVARNDFATAIGQYQRVLELVADHVPARNNLANALFLAGRMDEAIANYREILRRDPGNQRVRENLARALELRR